MTKEVPGEETEEGFIQWLLQSWDYFWFVFHLSHDMSPPFCHARLGFRWPKENMDCC